jgi:ADP-ribose pyrophosphatase YjhB (NUDIX family)
LKVTAIGGRDRVVCIQCDFVHWDNPKPVTATLIPIDDGLVLVKRKFEPYVGDWCLPGGFIEALETPHESAIREVEEETGLIVEVDKLLGAFAPGHSINVIILMYLARKTGGNLVPGDDASEAGVFNRDTLPQNVAFELHRKMIADYFAGSFAAAK